MNTKNDIDVSILIPVYYNEKSITLTIDKIKETVIAKQNRSFEIICIDDGSKDFSYEELEKLYSENPGLIKIIKLSRNFGQVQALLAGYQASKGKCVINISADLQDPPELMNEMITAYFAEGVPIVLCVRKDRTENYFRKKTSSVFYKLMKRLNFPDMPLGGFDYALIGRNVVEVVNNSTDVNPFLQGQILWTGFAFKLIPYERVNRSIGRSKWTFGKKIKYLIDGVLGYSYLPLRIISVTGIVIFILGISYAFFIVIKYIWGSTPYEGWAPIMILLLVLFGIVMLMLGVIGEYLWRVLDQVRNRPGYIIEKTLE